MTHSTGPEHYVHQYHELAQPKAGHKLVADDLKNALTFRNMYEAKPTPKGQSEAAFGKVASAYIASLYGGSFGSENAARDMVSRWFQGIPDGDAARRRLYSAIEDGNIVQIEAILQDTYVKAMHSTKAQSVISDLNNQPDDVRMGVAQTLAAQLGDVNSYKGSPVTLLSNPSLGLQGLEQRLALAESVSTAKGEGTPHH